MFLPNKIKSFLEGNRFYIKLRYSKWIYKIWLLLRADVRKEIQAKKDFYQSILPGDCKLIFDIGANEGILTEIFSNHSQKVIAVEPSDRNISVLFAKFSSRKNVIIVPEAISHVTGKQPWYEDKNDYATGTLSGKWNDTKQNRKNENTAQISTITLDDLIKQFGIPDYIKIDVEGYEWQVLQGLSQPVSLLSFEAILPQFYDETIVSIEHLLAINPNARFNYLFKNFFAYKVYKPADIILNDIKKIRQTVDLFCQM